MKGRNQFKLDKIEEGKDEDEDDGNRNKGGERPYAICIFGFVDVRKPYAICISGCVDVTRAPSHVHAWFCGCEEALCRMYI